MRERRPSRWIKAAADLRRRLDADPDERSEIVAAVAREHDLAKETLRRSLRAYDFLTRSAKTIGFVPDDVAAPLTSVEVLERLDRKAPRTATPILEEALAGRISYRSLVALERTAAAGGPKAPIAASAIRAMFADAGLDLRPSVGAPMSAMSTLLKPDFLADASDGTVALYLSPGIESSLDMGRPLEDRLLRAMAALTFVDTVFFVAADDIEEAIVRSYLAEVARPGRIAMKIVVAYGEWPH